MICFVPAGALLTTPPPNQALFEVGTDVWPHVGHSNKFTDLAIGEIERNIGEGPWRVTEITEPTHGSELGDGDWYYELMAADGRLFDGVSEIWISDVHPQEQIADGYDRQSRVDRARSVHEAYRPADNEETELD